MLGHGHAVMGATAWVAVAAPLELTGEPLAGVPSGFGLGAGALVAAGAALLPDLDHPGATVSRALPPVTTLLSIGIGAATGGHRKGSHSLLAIPVAAALAWLASLWSVELDGQTYRPGVAVASVVIASLGVKALRLGFHPTVTWLLSLGVGALVWHTLAPGEAGWFPLAVALGFSVHLLGDMLTTSGVPLLLPFTTRAVKVPILGPTGSLREHLLTAGFVLVLVVLLMSASGGAAVVLAHLDM